MGTTNLSWLEVAGVPTMGMGGAPYSPMSNWVFVDANNFTGASSDGNPGTAEAPVTTMSRAMTLVKSNGVISFIGNIREQITTPEGVFGVTVIGASTQPRNADAFTSTASNDGGRSGASWVSPASATADTPLIDVLQQGWRFENFLIGAGPANTASIRLYRDGGSGDEERDASHASFYGMYFSGCVMGIQLNGGPSFINVGNCYFRGATTTAIANTTGAGIGTNLGINIWGSRFFDNVNHIVCPMSGSTIKNNVFGNFTTMAIDLNNGIGNNMITGNLLTGTYSIAGGYRRAAATDNWAGNLSNDTGVTTVLTQADPA